MATFQASQSPRVVIVGGGTGGITAAAQLIRLVPSAHVTIIEPTDQHFYQPLWTLSGGGIVAKERSRRPMQAVIPRGVSWRRDAVEGFDPARNLVRTRSGEALSYDVLIVAAGLEIFWDKIAGLKESLGQAGVCSNYSYEHVDYTWEAIKQFRSGTALFTFPDTPIKCAGAPQKIMYLAERHFVRAGVRTAANVRYMSGIDKIFGAPKYAAVLSGICRDRGIEVTFKRRLTAVDAARRVATFLNLESGATEDVGFSLLHVAPPMGAPEFVRQSPLANAAGFVDVDKHTLQHVRYPNVFALGDASSLPTSKTGAAIRAQAPILVDHVLAVLAGRPLAGIYNGYTSCPLVTDYGKLVLAEFDYDLKPCETFPFDQGRERRSMYWLKRYGLPFLYWHLMLPGRTKQTLFSRQVRAQTRALAPAPLKGV